MARRLARTVTVQKYTGHGLNRVPEGDAVTFPKGSTPPKDWADLITNPSAWEDVPDVTPVIPAAPRPGRTRRAPAKSAPRKAAVPAVSPTNTPGPDGGNGGQPSTELPADDAGDEAWRAYAATVGVTVADDADTAAVKSELADRGLLDQ